jgi:hypothetical protein
MNKFITEEHGHLYEIELNKNGFKNVIEINNKKDGVQFIGEQDLLNIRKEIEKEYQEIRINNSKNYLEDVINQMNGVYSLFFDDFIGHFKLDCLTIPELVHLQYENLMIFLKIETIN